MDETSVEQLVEERRFDRAFELLMERYQERALRLAYSILGNESAAQDATQDAFVRAWRGLPKFRGGSSVATWLYAIVRNTCLTRRKAERPGLPLHDVAAKPFEDELAARCDLPRMLGQLREEYRQVIVLFHLQERSYQEVAEQLGLPIGTVKTYLYRGRRDLLELWQGNSAARQQEKEAGIEL